MSGGGWEKEMCFNVKEKAVIKGAVSLSLCVEYSAFLFVFVHSVWTFSVFYLEYYQHSVIQQDKKWNTW